MTTRITHPPILVAEDDPDDRLLIEEAAEASGLKSPLHFACNGEEVMTLLAELGRWDGNGGVGPALMLLDLNMPRMDGYEVLSAVRSAPELRTLPVIVLTTSRNPEDIRRCYDLGATAYVTKPSSFDGLVELFGSLTGFWFGVAEVPTH